MKHHNTNDLDDGERCPECFGDDIANGVVPDPTRPLQTADFGCRDCHHLWNAE